MTIGGKTIYTLANEIRNSLHFSLFSLTLFLLHQSVGYPVGLLIMIKCNHGPNLVPCGTPEETVLHSEKHAALREFVSLGHMG